MPFKQCACHVFAIDGYEDDNRMTLANLAYETFSPPQGTRPRRPTGWNPDRQLEAIINTIRTRTGAELSTTKIIVYGGFRTGQLQPEHMWVEHNSKIYDTMPDYELHATAASSVTRQCPYLEKEAFTGSGNVGKVAVYATNSQLKNMDRTIVHSRANIADSDSDSDSEEKKQQ